LDQFMEGFTIPHGRNAWDLSERRVAGREENIRAIKSLRLMDKELSKLSIRYLYCIMNLNSSLHHNPKRLRRWTEEMLPLVSQWVRFATVYVDDKNIESTCRILERCPNIQWLVLDYQCQTYSAPLVDSLCSLSKVSRLSLYPMPRQPATLDTHIALLERVGKNLKSLDMYCGWEPDPLAQLFRIVRVHVHYLQHLSVYCTRDSGIGMMLTQDPVWESRNTLKDVYFEECSEMEAWVVADMVRLCKNLEDVNISSCGGPGGYNNANGRDEERQLIVKAAKPIVRPPLNTLRIVHATDVEFRHMSRIPTLTLQVSDPLDQLFMGELLKQKEFFPGMKKFELQWVREIGLGNDEAFTSIKTSVEERGGVEFCDKRELYSYR